ncbi:oligosaccharide flippase family protein [Ferrovibrio sp. MS7]|uniref:lipopolysaccharide biosynthesis protein n=1 Tax=Ferrovibrio plantarum TaxID=3119164 RepID=UPI0031369E9E
MNTADLHSPEDFRHALYRDFGGYLVSIGLLALGNLLLLPLMITALSPEEIGLYSLVEAGATPGLTLSLLGLKFAYLYHHARQPESARPALLGTVLLVALASGIVTGSLLALFYGSAKAMALFDAAPLDSAWLLLPLMLSGAVQTLLITELRAERRVALAGFLAVGNLAVWLLASCVLVLWAGLGLPGLLIGQTCGQTLAALIGLAGIRRRPLFAWDGAQVQPLLRYGIPLMAGLLLRYSLDSLSRFLLAAWVGIEAAADYLIAARIAVLFDALLALPFFMAWGGLVHHALQRPRAAAIIGLVSNLSIAAGGLLYLLLVLLQPWLFLLFTGEKRLDLAPLFAALLLSQYLILIKSPLGAGLLRLPDTTWAAQNNLLALALYVPLAWPLMQLSGAGGAALAIAVVNLITGLILYLQGRKLCPQQPAVGAWILLALLVLLAPFALWYGGLPLWLPLPLLLLAGWEMWQSGHASVTGDGV